MNPSLRRSKMISIRLSPDEYNSLQSACTTQGVRSISDLARVAMHKLVLSDEPSGHLSDEVRLLKEKLQTISVELDRISRCIGTPVSKVEVGPVEESVTD